MRLALREIRRSKVRFILLTVAIGLLVYFGYARSRSLLHGVTQ